MELKYVEVNKVYISKDSMDCFYFYCTRLNESGPSGIRIAFWEDGKIIIDKNVYYTDRFEEEEPYKESSKYVLIQDIFLDLHVNTYED